MDFYASLKSNKYMANRVRPHLDLLQLRWEHFWCRKICKIVCRVQRKRVKSKFLYQDADVILPADKCIVVRGFVRRNYDTILMDTGKFSDNLRFTENGLVSGVDRAFKSSNSTFQRIGDRKECRHRHPLFLPTVWHAPHTRPWWY